MIIMIADIITTAALAHLLIEEMTPSAASASKSGFAACIVKCDVRLLGRR
jgi:hypothetical protein